MPGDPRPEYRHHIAAFVVGTLGVIAGFVLVDWLNWTAADRFGPWGVRYDEPQPRDRSTFPILPMVPSIAWVALLWAWIHHNPLYVGWSRRAAWLFAGGCWAFAIIPLAAYWLQGPW